MEVTLGRYTQAALGGHLPGHFLCHRACARRSTHVDFRKVSLVSRETVTALVREAFPKAEARETKLFAIDGPNYALTFAVGSDG
jgi:hypothetical protein